MKSSFKFICIKKVSKKQKNKKHPHQSSFTQTSKVMFHSREELSSFFSTESTGKYKYTFQLMQKCYSQRIMRYPIPHKIPGNGEIGISLLRLSSNTVLQKLKQWEKAAAAWWLCHCHYYSRAL